MLRVGTDTYIGIKEADQILKETPDAEQWDRLTVPEKERCLQTAARRMETLHYVGRKHSIFQVMAFPRDMSRFIPKAVKQAQAWEALSVAQAQKAWTTNRNSLFKMDEAMCSMEAVNLLRPYLLLRTAAG